MPPAFRSMLLLRAPLSLLERLSLRQQHCNGPGEGLPEAPRVWRHGRMHSRNVARRLVPLDVCLVVISLNSASGEWLAAPSDVACMETFHGKDAHEEECHTALPPAIAKLLGDVMPCDPHCNCTLPALPENVRHSHTIVSAELARSLALVSMVVHMGTGRRKARHIVFAQVAMLRTCNAERPAFEMWPDATRRVWAGTVTGSQKCTMHMPC